MAYDPPPVIQNNLIITPISVEEVKNEIKIARNRRGIGPDRISNERFRRIPSRHMGQAVQQLLIIWNSPESWRRSTIRVLYKGKGDIENPNSCWGIALENKIFIRILSQRLLVEIEVEQQFGFRKDRFSIQAIGDLMKMLLDTPKAKDITKEGNEVINFIRNLLALNKVQVTTPDQRRHTRDPTSPLLLTIATGDIMKYLNTVCLYMYADDLLANKRHKKP
ncbi:hypothetical protein ANN_27915 [Periplaneta americana]|uniref:Reverse transcriptase domain-containing protein n=1 Tax=Periplaneta americana TaxID=6978 RepID=A0ABQ8RVM1_PERAM|nr:hypothetical protein ANN_27915 [Periplaneta americana]